MLTRNWDTWIGSTSKAWRSQGTVSRVPGRKGAGSPKARTSVASSPWVAGSLYPYTSVDLNLGKIILINVPAAQNELLFEPGVANIRG